MSPLMLTLAICGAAGMWAVVLAVLAVGAACGRALASGSCRAAFNDVARRLGWPESKEPEWGFRLIIAVIGGYAMYVGVKGVGYMAETTHALYCFVRSP